MASPDPAPTLDSITLEQAKADVSTAVYQACALVETLANVGKLSGNGHYARQKIAAFAVTELESRWTGD